MRMVLVLTRTYRKMGSKEFSSGLRMSSKHARLCVRSRIVRRQFEPFPTFVRSAIQSSAEVEQRNGKSARSKEPTPSSNRIRLTIYRPGHPPNCCPLVIEGFSKDFRSKAIASRLYNLFGSGQESQCLRIWLMFEHDFDDHGPISGVRIAG